MFPIEVSVESPPERPDERFEVLGSPLAAIASQLYSIAFEGTRDPRDASWNSDAYWTQRVREVLSSIGTDLGFFVLPADHGDRAHSAEWLLDMVWLREKEETTPRPWRGLEELYLACECEWKTSAANVLEDFAKLTVVNAKYRVFVYANPPNLSARRGEHPVELCRGICPPSPKVTYLTVGVPGDQEAVYRVDRWTA